MEVSEYRLGFAAGQFVLLDEHGIQAGVLAAGDQIAFFVRGRFQPARVGSGGYRGWYYILADGCRARFALGMKACWDADERVA